MKNVILSVVAAGVLTISTPALAGEITGPPPGENLDDAPRLSNGKSWCSFSGLNDTPDGLHEEGDPGGIAQSYGYFLAHPGELTKPLPNDPDVRSTFAFPGTGCSPQRSPFPIPGE